MILLSLAIFTPGQVEASGNNQSSVSIKTCSNVKVWLTRKKFKYVKRCRFIKKRIYYTQKIVKPINNNVVNLLDQQIAKHGLQSESARIHRIAKCESGYNSNAKNKNSSASGVFQQLATYWPARAAKYGFAGASVFDAEANISVSLQMMKAGMWNHWSCK